MIDELKILQEIIGDLSGLGGWLVGAYLSYKLIFMCVLLYAFNLVVSAVVRHLKADITREEANLILSGAAAVELKLNGIKEVHSAEMTRKDAEHYAAILEVNTKIERVKHMYKILKESKGEKDE